LKRVDKELHGVVREMFELMYEAKGVGLAANQVDLPYRLFVLNLESDPTATDQEYVFLNPVLTSRKGNAEAEEGCLSLPTVYADVKRPERVVLNAYNLAGEELTLELDGLFARAVQHEIDHLQGVLFIDNMGTIARLASRGYLRTFERDYKKAQERGDIPPDDEIIRKLKEMEDGFGKEEPPVM
jgi:peptide deformylase